MVVLYPCDPSKIVTHLTYWLIHCLLWWWLRPTFVSFPIRTRKFCIHLNRRRIGLYVLYTFPSATTLSASHPRNSIPISITNSLSSSAAAGVFGHSKKTISNPLRSRPTSVYPGHRSARGDPVCAGNSRDTGRHTQQQQQRQHEASAAVYVAVLECIIMSLLEWWKVGCRELCGEMKLRRHWDYYLPVRSGRIPSRILLTRTGTTSAGKAGNMSAHDRRDEINNSNRNNYFTTAS